MPQFSVTTKSGRYAFVSEISDDEAAERLKSHDGFARGLSDQHRRGVPWSDAQRAWAHYHAKNGPHVSTQDTFPRIVALLDKAAKKLKNPKLFFKDAAFGQDIRLARAGSRSKYPGSVTVTDGRAYADARFFGRINRDGTTTVSLHTVLAFLRDFESDPVAKAAEYGKRSGTCIFCNRPLTDVRSTHYGYGPICAAKHDMPWGG